jgi:tricorn protease
VEPDIEVDNLPELEMAGRDPQLEKTVEVVLERIDAAPPRLPERPAYPRDKLR